MPYPDIPVLTAFPCVDIIVERSYKVNDRSNKGKEFFRTSEYNAIPEYNPKRSIASVDDSVPLSISTKALTVKTVTPLL